MRATTNHCRLAERLMPLKGSGNALAGRSLRCFIRQFGCRCSGDLRHEPPLPFGLRPSASRIDTNWAYAHHEQLRSSLISLATFQETERS